MAGLEGKEISPTIGTPDVEHLQNDNRLTSFEQYFKTTTYELPSEVGESYSKRYGVRPVTGENRDTIEMYSARPEREPPRNEKGEIICQHESCIGKSEVFRRPCEWNKHMDRHELPYKCNEATCERNTGFAHSGGLLRHMREIHKKGVINRDSAREIIRNVAEGKLVAKYLDTVYSDTQDPVTAGESSLQETKPSSGVNSAISKLKKILIANRGEIPIRTFKTAEELKLATVAVYSYEERLKMYRDKISMKEDLGPENPAVIATAIAAGHHDSEKGSNVGRIKQINQKKSACPRASSSSHESATHADKGQRGGLCLGCTINDDDFRTSYEADCDYRKHIRRKVTDLAEARGQNNYSSPSAYSRTYGDTTIDGNSSLHQGDNVSNNNNYFVFNQGHWNAPQYWTEHTWSQMNEQYQFSNEQSYTDPDSFQADPMHMFGHMLNKVMGMMGTTINNILSSTMSSIIPLLMTQIQSVQCWQHGPLKL